MPKTPSTDQKNTVYLDTPYKTLLGLDMTPRKARRMEAAATASVVALAGFGLLVVLPWKADHDRQAAIAEKVSASKEAQNEAHLGDIAKSSETFKAGEPSKNIPVLSADMAFAKFIQTHDAQTAKNNPLRILDLPTDLTHTTEDKIGATPVIAGKFIAFLPTFGSTDVPGLRYELTSMVSREDFQPQFVHLSATHDLGDTNAAVQIVESEDRTQTQYVLDITSTNTHIPENTRLVAWVEPAAG